VSAHVDPKPQIDPEILRGFAFSGGRRREPHHDRDDDDFDGNREHRLPEKDRVPERDDARWHDAAMRDDVANLRLQRARRGHLQRGRPREALSPDAAQSEKTGGRERAVIDALDATRHFAGEHGAEDQAEAPVHPRARSREERDHGDGARGVAGRAASSE